MPLTQREALGPRALLRDDVYVRLRDAIVDGTLEPGEQLRDAELAASLGVSRTPVREALLQLQRSGLVLVRPGRSTEVATIDARAVREAQAVVATMHELAVRVAVPRLSTNELDRMREANERFADALRRDDPDAALAADDDFHAVPVVAAANQALRTVLDQLTPTLRRVERLRFASLAGRGSVTLHQRLIRRCEAGDADGAAAVSFETWQTLEPLLASLTESTPPGPTTR